MNGKDYQPISCSFYDELEAIATLKKESIIKFYNTDQEEKQIVSKIHDLYTKDKVEYMKLKNDKTIRLDQLIAVDGKILEQYC